LRTRPDSDLCLVMGNIEVLFPTDTLRFAASLVFDFVTIVSREALAAGVVLTSRSGAPALERSAREAPASSEYT